MNGRTGKLSEQTADRLYTMIVDQGLYPAGSKLPNENELSREMNVSRTTLREAISFLVTQGVLEIRRGKGTFVAKELPNKGLDLSELADMRSRVRASDLFEMRLIFEPATVALACQRASDEELEEIRRKAERMERLQGWAEAAAEVGRIGDAVRCVDLLNKMDGAYEPERLEVTGDEAFRAAVLGRTGCEPMVRDFNTTS